jgi:hypothetical protein
LEFSYDFLDALTPRNGLVIEITSDVSLAISSQSAVIWFLRD